MSLVEPPVNSDALKFFVMNMMNWDVEDSSFRVRPSCMNRFCPLWNQQRSQSSRGCWWCKALPYFLGLVLAVTPDGTLALLAGCCSRFFHVSQILEAERALVPLSKTIPPVERAGRGNNWRAASSRRHSLRRRNLVARATSGTPA